MNPVLLLQRGHNFRYYWLHYGRTAVVTAAARAAHSDAADNEPKRDADIEVALLRDASVFRLLRQPQTAQRR